MARKRNGVSKTVNRIWRALGLPCRRCHGQGVVIDGGVVEFCQTHGVRLWQVGNAVLANEEGMYGPTGTLPGDAWAYVGFTDEAQLDFFDNAHCHEVLACPECDPDGNHGNALGAAKAAITNAIDAERERTRAWKKEKQLFEPTPRN